MEAKGRPERVCPYCNEKLGKLDYVEYGRVTWNGAAWEEAAWDAEREYSCPNCDAELTHEDLVEFGLA